MDVSIIGMGPGDMAQLTLAAQEAIMESDVLVGDKRMVEPVYKVGKTVFYTTKPSEIKGLLQKLPTLSKVAVVVSGDVGFFSLAACLTDLPGCTVRRYAGISSLVYFAATLSISWQDAYIVSRHGRDQNLVAAVWTHEKVFCLTGGENTPDALCRELCAAGLGDVTVYVGERLSYSDERICQGTAAELAQQAFAPLNVMFILNAQAKPLTTPVHGLADTLFIRGKAPMTKQEIRAIAIAKLQPHVTDVLYDIGAGTGSCTVELARQAPLGQVFAFEINADALVLLPQNIEKFGLTNVTIVPGNAAETLQQDFPTPQGVFIGGTKGKLASILDSIYTKNPSCSVVITAITLETLTAITMYYQDKAAYTLDIMQITAATSKTVGNYHMMLGHNPVYIVTAEVVR